MKRLVFIAALVVTTMFSGCEKDKIDYNNLVGSVWEAKTDYGVTTLHFVDETECTFNTPNEDGTSYNLRTYPWKYISDSEPLFLIYPKDEVDGYNYYYYYFRGKVVKKILYLEFINPISSFRQPQWCFERKSGN